ncbi:MAG TPA: hypothetical protein VGC81_10940, partial [Candidatus Methylomirabilis sp.]
TAGPEAHPQVAPVTQEWLFPSPEVPTVPHSLAPLEVAVAVVAPSPGPTELAVLVAAATPWRAAPRAAGPVRPARPELGFLVRAAAAVCLPTRIPP